MFQLTCGGVAVSCAEVALSEPGSISINRKPIGILEFQGGAKAFIFNQMLLKELERTAETLSCCAKRR